MTRRSEGRVFALTLSGGFLFVSALAYWRSAETIVMVAGSLAAISLLAALLFPGHLGPVMLAWMKLGEVIGRITTPILMAIVYFVVVTPIAIVRRVFAPRRRPSAKSGWHRRPPLPPRERLERQF